MSYENVKEFFTKMGLDDRIRVLPTSSATVALAAEAVGCEAGQIAKTLSFLVDELPVLVVAAGNSKVDNQKFKATFAQKAKMMPRDIIESLVGHDAGGVCPFAIKDGITVYLDVSLKQNDSVYPAAGSENSVVHLTLQELEQIVAFKGWVDVCKIL